MANRRMLSKSASTSRKLMKVSDFAALLWTWTIPHCDDLGHMDGSAEMIKGIVVPLRNKTLDEINTALSELEGAELIKIYEIEGDKYLEIVKWEEYQTFKNDRELQQDFPIAPWNPKVSKRNPNGKIVRLIKEKLSKENLREEKGSEVVAALPHSPEDFFIKVQNKGEEFDQFLVEFCEKTKVPQDAARKELIKFADYWTEKNATGKKERWQLEKVFEVRRRLVTWFSRAGMKGSAPPSKYKASAI